MFQEAIFMGSLRLNRRAPGEAPGIHGLEAPWHAALDCRVKPSSDGT
jgi:hypothetical protein